MENTELKITNYLARYGYDILDDLQGNDESLCDELVDDATSYHSLSDALMDVAFNNIETCKRALFEMGYELYSRGFCDVSMNELGNTEIADILEGAHKLYIEQLLYNNLSNIIYNIAINYINENELEVTSEEFEEHLECELNAIKNHDIVSYIFDMVDEYIQERMKDKISDVLEGFNKDYFISSMCDGMIEKISECLETSFDIDVLLDMDILHENDLDGQILEEYDMLDDYTELCENIAIDLEDKFKSLNSEYFIDRDFNVISVRNSPELLVQKLKKLLEDKEMTVNDMDNIVCSEIEYEYEINEYYGGFREGDTMEMLYENKSCSYQLGDEIWLNISWSIVEVNEEDCFKTVIKVTDVELI